MQTAGNNQRSQGLSNVVLTLRQNEHRAPRLEQKVGRLLHPYWKDLQNKIQTIASRLAEYCQQMQELFLPELGRAKQNIQINAVKDCFEHVGGDESLDVISDDLHRGSVCGTIDSRH